MDSRALDSWITRGPYEFADAAPLRCAGCGKFLPVEPTFERESVRVMLCSGEPRVVACKHDEATLAIIGEEFRGETFEQAYPPTCGSMAGSRHATYDGEISPEDTAKWKHEPHWFVPDWGYERVDVRVCSCGCVNERMIL